MTSSLIGALNIASSASTVPFFSPDCLYKSIFTILIKNLKLKIKN